MRIVVAALLGAAALLCAGLWMADALSPPKPANRPYFPDYSEVIRLRSSRYDVTIRLADARLELLCSANVCWLCAHFTPDHDPNCFLWRYPNASLSFVACVEGPGPAHNVAIPGLRYSDRWAAPAGLLSANLYISLWLLIALLAPYPLYVFIRGLLRRLRRRPGVCSACGYDLTGNVSGVCPECGQPLTAAA